MANIKKDFASPNGPILLLSAKGSTTASIAEANGVKDFSGNGNHGQAFGTGILVSEDNEMGACFDCQGTNGSYLLVQHGVLDNKREFTIHFKWKSSEPSSNNWVFVASGDGTVDTRQIASSGSTSQLSFSIHDTTNNTNTGSCVYNQNAFDGILHTFTYVVDFNNAIAILYVDGVKFTEGVVNVASTYKITSQHFTFGNAWTSFKNAPHKGKLADIRIYPRALSAAEVKYLYNGFQPNLIMGQTIPSGAILDLSARGLTTAGIAQANGVADRSGNGNHGQAYNGVAVVNDDEMGSCFSFDGTGYIEGSTSVSPTSMTFVFLFSYYFTDTQAQSCLISFNPSNIIGGLYLERASKKIKFYNATSSGPGNYYTNTLFEQNTLYHIVAVSDAVNGLKLYVNGILDAEYDNVYLTHSTTFSYGIGNSTQTSGNKLKGKMSDIRIYPRALTASEVQQLANASLKKITNIKKGNSEIKNIYYGSNLVYAKTEDYVSSGLYRIGSIQLSSVSRVCIKLHNGDYAMTDWGNHCIHIYDSAGNLKTSFGSQGYGDGLFANPYGICEDPDGYLYTSDWRGQNSSWYIQKLYYNGNTVSFVDKLSMSGGASQIIYAPGRDCIIANTYGGGTIYQISRDLSSKTAICSGIYLPVGVGMSSDGKTLYATSYGGYLYRATYASASSTSPSSSGRILTIGSGGTAQGIALSDDNSYLLLVDNTDKNIQKVNLSDNTNSVIISDMCAFCIMNNGGNFFTFVGGPSDSIYPYKLLM